jgi:glycosidase
LIRKSGKEFFNRNNENKIVLDTSFENRPKDYSDGFSLFNNVVGGFPILNPNYEKINVEDQEKDLNSPLNFYRKLLKLRKDNPIMQYGKFQEFKQFYALNSNNLGSKMVSAYTLSNKYLIITNLDFIPYQVKLKSINMRNIILNTHNTINYASQILHLKPYQGLVIRLGA